MQKQLTEKYRPTSIKDVLLEPIAKDLLMKYASCKFLNSDKTRVIPPNLLLYGPPGTGKTTIARALCNEWQLSHEWCKNAILEINVSEERTGDVITERIKPFCESPNFGVLILDEIDSFGVDKQHVVKTIIEQTTNKVFILACNFIKEITEELSDECVAVKINASDKMSVFNRVKEILKIEQITNPIVETDEELMELVDKFYPDIRRIINTATLH